MLEIILISPLLCGGFIFLLPIKTGRYLLVVTGVWNLAYSIYIWCAKPGAFLDQYFRLSPEGLLVLMITSFLFFVVSLYCLAYLENQKLPNERIFNSSMLFFLAAMSMATIADHMIIFWIAIETTTLASAPLILLHKTKGSLEATWKYILICSVGIALALLGTMLLTISMDVGGIESSLFFSEFPKVANRLDKTWLKAGFVFILVGYGTKMGLAPMHTWLPDAHSEAASPASALLSGALLNCAYLGILKTTNIMEAAQMGDFARNVLIGFGLLSIFVSATFILQQSDYKRLLAYSSIENMGIIAVGTGVGGFAAYGAMLHLIHHSLIKSSLFLSSGNILLAYGTKLIDKTGNMARQFPKTFFCFVSGFVGIVGFPPFGIFISELIIVLGAFQKGRYMVLAALLFCLLFIGAGLAKYVIRISFSQTENTAQLQETPLLFVPQIILLLVSIILCFWMPDSLIEVIIHSGTGIVGGLNG
ncbi:MAG: hydrogenase [SAR324 cluster bacterium]|nr:hydrogenase [SAR324 cluster bacterium]